jgi:hypothetical protein
MRMMALKNKYGVSACVTAESEGYGTVHFFGSMTARTNKGNVTLDGIMVQEHGRLLLNIPPQLHGELSVVLSKEGSFFINDIATQIK